MNENNMNEMTGMTEYYAEGPSGSRMELEPIGTYTAKTFGWMFLGLMTTFAVSIAMIMSGAILLVYSVPFMPFLLLLAEFGLVICLSARVESMSLSTAKGLFFAYAVVNGIVFSSVFILYDLGGVLLAFLSASLYFGIMAGVGYFTKADLSGMRPILLSGAIFLVIFWVLSIFLNLAAFERVVCLIGVAVFLGFTAYDTQKIKSYHQAFCFDPVMAKKASIYAALELYLDFVNLFLYILRIVGNRK